MHGHEHVGLLPTSTRDALAMLDEMVAIAREHGAHAGLAVDALFQAPRDRERHALLARTGFADRARVDAAVPRVDRDDHVAAVRLVGGLHGNRRRARRDGTEIDDQAMAVAAGRRDIETVRRRRRRKIDDEAHVAAALRTDAQLLHEALPFGQHARGIDASIFDIDDDAIRILQRHDAVLDRRGQIEDESRRIRTGPEPHVFHSDWGRSVSERREQQCDAAEGQSGGA